MKFFLDKFVIRKIVRDCFVLLVLAMRPLASCFAVTVILVSCFMLLVTSDVSAHIAGQPPFFKVNGKFSDLYHVPTTSLPTFNLPQDGVSETFLIGESIDFEIDKTLLPIPVDIADNTDFTWDFGDGGGGVGLKNSYAYKKQGSFILTISAKYKGDSNPPQLLQSLLINVVPSKDYKLPKALITINDSWQTKDPLLDSYKGNFSKEFTFDASKSEASSKITEYTWDFGDQSEGKNEKETHTYSTSPYTVFPVLRIKTEDGFIADAFVQIVDENSDTSNPISSITKNLTNQDPRSNGELNLTGKIILGAVGLIIFYGIALFIKGSGKKK